MKRLVTMMLFAPALASAQQASSYKEFYPDGRLKAIRHEGIFNGCHMPVSTDTLFYPSGKVEATISYDNRKSLTDEGCHQGWTIETKHIFHTTGLLKAISKTRHLYEGSDCNCGEWRWYNTKGKMIRLKKYSRCTSQAPCAEP